MKKIDLLRIERVYHTLEINSEEARHLREHKTTRQRNYPFPKDPTV